MSLIPAAPSPTPPQPVTQILATYHVGHFLAVCTPLLIGIYSRGSPNNDSVMEIMTVETDAPPRTAAELAREKKLRDDPMAEVHGPLFVTCKRCSSRIKLSPKSSYDPFHWMKHRERCLRKPVGAARATRRAPKDIYASPAKDSPASSSNTDGDNVTPPPLTPDDDRVATDDIFTERSISPNIDDLELSTRPVHVPLLERWQTWNWSELRPPTWMASNGIVCASDDQEDYDDDLDDSLLDLVEMRYPAPRLTLHPSTRNQDASPSSA